MSEEATLQAIEAHRKIEQVAELASNDMRIVDAICEGKAVRQGDIYIHRVSANHPHGNEAKGNQLAIGSDQNARHCAEAPARVYEGTTAPDGCNTPFLGPTIIADKPFVVSHPEHAHIKLPAGVYQVSHQSDPRTMDRVRD